MRNKVTPAVRADPGCEAALADVVGLVAAARGVAARTVNAVITTTYWSIGRRIVEQEQHGAARAGYGEELVRRLSLDLSERFGRGFGRRNLFQKVQTASALFWVGTMGTVLAIVKL